MTKKEQRLHYELWDRDERGSERERDILSFREVPIESLWYNLISYYAFFTCIVDDADKFADRAMIDSDKGPPFGSR